MTPYGETLGAEWRYRMAAMMLSGLLPVPTVFVLTGHANERAPLIVAAAWVSAAACCGRWRTAERTHKAIRESMSSGERLAAALDFFTGRR